MKNKVISFLQKEFITNNSIFEHLFLITGIILQVIVFNFTNCDTLSFISGLSGIIAVVFCAQRKITQFIFSFTQLFTYIVIVYNAHLYGELIENIFYFLTMLYGIAIWISGFNKSEQIIETKKLSHNVHRFIMSLTFVCTVIMLAILKETNDPHPILDAISTVPAFTAQILMMARYKECWIYWLIIDIASIIMWGMMGNMLMVVQFIFWSINCIYGYIKWDVNKI